MGGSGLQWSFSGNHDSPSKILSFKSASEIYAPGFVQKVVSAEKSNLVNRQTQNYGALINHSRDVLKVSTVKNGRLVGSPLNTPSPVVSNGINRGNLESVGSAYRAPSVSVSPVSLAVVGSTNLSGESSFNGPSQMTIFYNGLVCVYDDVAPDKAQAIMLLAGNGNSRSQKPAEPAAKAQPLVVVPSPAPSKAVDVTGANPSSIVTKPISLTDFSASSSSRVSKQSSGPSMPAHVATPNDPVSVSACTSTVEVNSRNPTPKYLSQSDLPVDQVSAAASTSTVEVLPTNSASKFTAPITSSIASNQIRFPQSAKQIEPVSAGASRIVEVNPRNPALRYPSPITGSTGISRFRFSKSAIPIDPVLAGACESPKNPASKFPPPSTGSSGPNQIRFSQSVPVPVRASTGRIEVSSNNQATKFSPPTTGSVGSTQIRFAQPALPIDPGRIEVTCTNEANTKNSASNFPPSGSQIRFSRSVFPNDPGSAGAQISIVESNPINPNSAAASGCNKFRYPQSTSGIISSSSAATPIDQASYGVSNSNAERNTIKPATGSVSKQNRYSQSATPNEATSDNASNSITESKPATCSGSNHRFSQSATTVSYERASSGVSSSTGEGNSTKPASSPPKGSGDEPNQLRFSQSGVPLARKASLARFLEKKRKDRPACDVGSLSDLAPAKFRSNSG